MVTYIVYQGWSLTWDTSNLSYFYIHSFPFLSSKSSYQRYAGPSWPRLPWCPISCSRRGPCRPRDSWVRREARLCQAVLEWFLPDIWEAVWWGARSQQRSPGHCHTLSSHCHTVGFSGHLWSSGLLLTLQGYNTNIDIKAPNWQLTMVASLYLPMHLTTLPIRPTH